MGHRRDGDVAADGGARDRSRGLRDPIAAATNAAPTRVYVGRVPSSLCLHEPGIRQLFGSFGTITTVTVHHDALSMGADGFMFLEFVDADAAHAAVAAVTKAEETNDATFEGMCARIAIARGASSFQADAAVVDLLLGRRQASSANPFSQHSAFLSQHDELDEDELVLQSLSQRAPRRSSQTTGKKRKKHSRGLNDD